MNICNLVEFPFINTTQNQISTPPWVLKIKNHLHKILVIVDFFPNNVKSASNFSKLLDLILLNFQ